VSGPCWQRREARLLLTGLPRAISTLRETPGAADASCSRECAGRCRALRRDAAQRERFERVAERCPGAETLPTPLYRRTLGWRDAFHRRLCGSRWHAANLPRGGDRARAKPWVQPARIHALVAVRHCCQLRTSYASRCGRRWGVAPWPGLTLFVSERNAFSRELRRALSRPHRGATEQSEANAEQPQHGVARVRLSEFAPCSTWR